MAIRIALVAVSLTVAFVVGWWIGYSDPMVEYVLVCDSPSQCSDNPHHKGLVIGGVAKQT
jgi:hypothetical protein